jgi:hypothetical protein
MPKRTKGKAQHPDCSLQHWRCQHLPGYSEITAYAEASQKWELVAVVSPASGVSANEVAEFIIRALNESQRDHDLLRAAMLALEGVMEEGLTYSTEQDADVVVQRIKRVGV